MASVPPVLDRVSFAVHRINARLAQVCNPRFARHGVDIFSSRILSIVLERGSIRVGELVDIMVLPQSTVSHQLQRLEKRRLIKRLRARDDNRAVTVTLTALGQGVAEDCNTLSAQVYHAMIKDFAPDELAAMRRFTVRMFDNLSAFDASTD